MDKLRLSLLETASAFNEVASALIEYGQHAAAEYALDSVERAVALAEELAQNVGATVRECGGVWTMTTSDTPYG